MGLGVSLIRVKGKFKGDGGADAGCYFVQTRAAYLLVQETDRLPGPRYITAMQHNAMQSGEVK